MLGEDTFNEMTIGKFTNNLCGRGEGLLTDQQENESMFVVLLKFSDDKSKAGRFMEGHKEWIRRGFDDGVFLLAGSLKPDLGGGIVAHNTSLPDLQSRVNADPFVVENVVKAEILEVTPARTDERLKFLLN
jgi:uncharacterized protein YciI